MMFGLLCGASIGREGPTVQVGAAIMGYIGRKAPIVYQQNLLLAGAAAGIAAAFNTPLAGIVFGIEELSRSFEAKASGLVHRLHHRRRRHLAGDPRRLHLLRHDGRHHAARHVGWLVVPFCAVARRGARRRSSAASCCSSSPAIRRMGVRRLGRCAGPILFAVLCGLGVAI